MTSLDNFTQQGVMWN